MDHHLMRRMNELHAELADPEQAEQERAATAKAEALLAPLEAKARHLREQQDTRLRHEAAIEALSSAAEHMRVGVAVGPIPIEVRPVVEAWLCRLIEQRRERARRDAIEGAGR